MLPAALGGIVSGACSPIARAAGETAPLLFTILTTTEINRALFHGAEHGALDPDLRERHLARTSAPRPAPGARR